MEGVRFLKLRFKYWTSGIIKFIVLVALLGIKTVTAQDFDEKIDHYFRRIDIGNKSVNLNCYKQLMLLYDKKANFHQSIFETSLSASLWFYQEYLASVKLEKISPYYEFYFAKGFFEAGKNDSAIKYFTNFKNRIKAKHEQGIAAVWIAGCKYRLGQYASSESTLKTLRNNEDISLKLEAIYLSMRLRLNLDTNQIWVISNSINKQKVEKVRELGTLIYLLPSIKRFDLMKDIIDKVDSKAFYPEKDIPFYDPTIQYNLSYASSYLSHFYANVINSIVTEEGQGALNTKYYRNLYFFKNGAYNECCKELVGDSTILAQALFGCSLMKTGRSFDADRIFNLIETSGSDNNKEILYRIYSYSSYNPQKVITGCYKLMAKNPSREHSLLLMQVLCNYRQIDASFGRDSIGRAVTLGLNSYDNKNPNSIVSNTLEYRIAMAYVFLLRGYADKLIACLEYLKQNSRLIHPALNYITTPVGNLLQVIQDKSIQ